MGEVVGGEGETLRTATLSPHDNQQPTTKYIAGDRPDKRGIRDSEKTPKDKDEMMEPSIEEHTGGGEPPKWSW